MNNQIELYHGVDHKFFGKIPFMPILRESLSRLLNLNLDRAYIKIFILNVPEDFTVGGVPIVENLIPEFGYSYVQVDLGGFLIYQHPHPLSDVITQTLQNFLRDNYPEETQWSFRLDIPGMPQVTDHRPTPYVEGGFTVHSDSLVRKPTFSIRRVAEPEPPSKELSDFGIEPFDAAAPIVVLLSQSLHDELCQSRPLSKSVEEGGFLIGKVYQHGNDPNAYLLEITQALTATYTGASLLHFTFTGDSFAEAKRVLRQDHPDDRILGWYHTHLFPATDTFGLSSIDLKLHFSTFTIPWQIAGLINLDGNRRTLRFYSARNNEMILCPYQVIK